MNNRRTLLTGERRLIVGKTYSSESHGRQQVCKARKLGCWSQNGPSVSKNRPEIDQGKHDFRSISALTHQERVFR